MYWGVCSISVYPSVASNHTLCGVAEGFQIVPNEEAASLSLGIWRGRAHTIIAMCRTHASALQLPHAGQNQWYHFGAPPILVYFSGDLGFSLGVRDFDPWPHGWPMLVPDLPRPCGVGSTPARRCSGAPPSAPSFGCDDPSGKLLSGHWTVGMFSLAHFAKGC